MKLVNAMQLNGYPNLNKTELWYASACPRFYTLMKMGTFGHIPEFKVFTECPIRNQSFAFLEVTSSRYIFLNLTTHIVHTYAMRARTYTYICIWLRFHGCSL